MRLRFEEARVTATFPCIPPVRGTYRFDRGVIEFKLPKPSMKPCPQRSSFWLADYFFGDNDALTLRIEGDKMTLVGTGGEYRFIRG